MVGSYNFVKLMRHYSFLMAYNMFDDSLSCVIKDKKIANLTVRPRNLIRKISLANLSKTFPFRLQLFFFIETAHLLFYKIQITNNTLCLFKFFLRMLQ